ncbi:hypothetical protein OPAG_03030 [Rhodococcus opacus PD630]|nr:hypothetical protein Pd630_LPD01010 [Rhodococcus opacus PD630]EHI44689.1 hypothetical protein OPAG_03030 [Rhodococcus opacus PD630]
MCCHDFVLAVGLGSPRAPTGVGIRSASSECVNFRSTPTGWPESRRKHYEGDAPHNRYRPCTSCAQTAQNEKPAPTVSWPPAP